MNRLKLLLNSKIAGFIPVRILLGIVLGALGGYFYYFFVGCRGNGCPLSSHPWISVLWGTALGILFTWKK
jgi:hypothetical protein